VGGDWKAFGADVFTKSEEATMSPQILLCRFHALIDLDLLDAGIALDVQNAIGNKEVIVEFLCAADIQDRVRFAIKLSNSAKDFIARARKFFESFGAENQAPSLSASMFRVMPGVRFLSANTADAQSVISRCSTAR